MIEKLPVQKGKVKANVKTSKIMSEAKKVAQSAMDKKKKMSGMELKALKKK
jgi:hypothetical protein